MARLQSIMDWSMCTWEVLCSAFKWSALQMSVRSGRRTVLVMSCFLVYLLPSCSIHYWKWGTEVSKYCPVVYFSPQFCQFLLQVFCSLKYLSLLSLQKFSLGIGTHTTVLWIHNHHSLLMKGKCKTLKSEFNLYFYKHLCNFWQKEKSFFVLSWRKNIQNIMGKIIFVRRLRFI